MSNGAPDVVPGNPEEEMSSTHYINNVFDTGSKALTDYLAANPVGKEFQNGVIETVEEDSIPPNPHTGKSSTRVVIRLAKKNKSAKW